MLVEQGALAFERWFGAMPDRDAMWKAATGAHGGGERPARRSRARAARDAGSRCCRASCVACERPMESNDGRPRLRALLVPARAAADARAVRAAATRPAGATCRFCVDASAVRPRRALGLLGATRGRQRDRARAQVSRLDRCRSRHGPRAWRASAGPPTSSRNAPRWFRCRCRPLASGSAASTRPRCSPIHSRRAGAIPAWRDALVAHARDRHANAVDSRRAFRERS